MGMKETYISVDIETAGPIPGQYSMLTLGACIVGNDTETFYVEIAPISNDFVLEAMKIVGQSLEHYAEVGVSPQDGMKAFADWVKRVSEKTTPVFVGFNASFDWAFVNWYFHQFFGENPFGFAAIDIKSYYMGLVGCSWAATRSSKIPAKYKGAAAHTHHALDDAIEQGKMFELMLQERHLA
jgi:ribonuclease T